MIKKAYLILLLPVLFSCRPEKPGSTIAGNSYFDLKGYLGKEISRYTETNPFVEKTVSINGKAESKNIRVIDWSKELAVFIDADINKSAWKGDFKVDSSSNYAQYASTSEKIPVKQMFVFRADDKIVKVEIILSNRNLLYQSNDTLSYYPDSLYKIIKTQKIRLMDGKRYEIVGRIK